MTTYITYDGSFTGLMTVIYDIFQLKIETSIVQSRFNKDLNLYTTSEITSCDLKAKRTLAYLKTILTKQELDLVNKAFLSEKENSEQLIVSALCQSIKVKSSIFKDFSNSDVVAIHKIVKSVDREKHRMKAFIRFQEIDDKFFYAECQPDFDVLPLLIRHFRTRYADQKWIIYDLKRNYGIFYDLTQVQYIELERNNLSASNVETSDLFDYAKLWSTYFKKTNIRSRRNTRLFVRHVPKRYWRHLTELG